MLLKDFFHPWNNVIRFPIKLVGEWIMEAGGCLKQHSVLAMEGRKQWGGGINWNWLLTEW
jgi:hypothetical protein